MLGSHRRAESIIIIRFEKRSIDHQDDQLARSVQCDERSGATLRGNDPGLRISEMVGDTDATAMWGN